MAKRVFFSFHYQDVIDFRANVVRNHWLTKSDREDAGFFDASIWETAKRTSSLALKRLINSETSVYHRNNCFDWKWNLRAKVGSVRNCKKYDKRKQTLRRTYQLH